MIGREYGIGKYGRNTYDHWRGSGDVWVPIPVSPPVDVWAPVEGAAGTWASAAMPVAEIWVPVPEATQPWTPVDG
jgi:hypothetical protein